MPDNKENGFTFHFEDFDDDIDISSSSKPSKYDEYEDIVSSSKKEESISFGDFQDMASSSKRNDSGKYSRKKKVKQNAMSKWWDKRSKAEKGLLIASVVLFTLICLGVIWVALPFLQLRGKVFCSAFGLMCLNLLVYFTVIWKKRNAQKAIMGVISIILSVLMIVSLFFWIPFLNLIYNFDHDFPSDAEDLAAVPPIDKNITNIALFGIDTRDTESFKGNSDSIMILSMNAKTHTVKIISVMRDSLVPIDNKGNKYYSKINSAYAKGGAELAVKTLNTIFDLDITEYATVNFFGMSKIIDAVGGIEVELTPNEVKARGNNNHGINDMIGEVCQLTGKDPAKYFVKHSGKQVLNGIQAVAYSRIRYVANIWGTNNDYGRTDRQRFVMEQLFNKALTLKKSSYPGLIKSLIPYTVTSLSPDQILIFAYNMLSGSPKFEQERLPRNEFLMTSPSGNFGSVVYYDLDYASKLIHSFIYDGISFDDYIEQNGIEKHDWYRKGFNKPGNGGNSDKPNKPGKPNSRPSDGNESKNSNSSSVTSRKPVNSSSVNSNNSSIVNSNNSSKPTESKLDSSGITSSKTDHDESGNESSESPKDPSESKEEKPSESKPDPTESKEEGNSENGNKPDAPDNDNDNQQNAA